MIIIIKITVNNIKKNHAKHSFGLAFDFIRFVWDIAKPLFARFA